MKTSLGARPLAMPTLGRVVSTYHSNGRENGITVVALGGISCSHPPCVRVALREVIHTYGPSLDEEHSQ